MTLKLPLSLGALFPQKPINVDTFQPAPKPLGLHIILDNTDNYQMIPAGILTPENSTPPAAAHLFSTATKPANLPKNFFDESLQASPVTDYASIVLENPDHTSTEKALSNLYDELSAGDSKKLNELINIITIRRIPTNSELDSYDPKTLQLVGLLQKIAKNHPEHFTVEHEQFLTDHSYMALEFIKPIYMIHGLTPTSSNLSDQDSDLISLASNLMLNENYVKAHEALQKVEASVKNTFGEESLEWAEFQNTLSDIYYGLSKNPKLTNSEAQSLQTTSLNLLENSLNIVASNLSGKSVHLRRVAIELGDFYNGRHDFDNAGACFSVAITECPVDTEHDLIRANIYLKQIENTLDNIQHYEDISLLNFVDVMNAQKAISLFEKYNDADNLLEAQEILGDFYLMQGRAKEAQAVLQKAWETLEALPRDSHEKQWDSIAQSLTGSHLLLARKSLKQGKAEEAQTQYSLALNVLNEKMAYFKETHILALQAVKNINLRLQDTIQTPIGSSDYQHAIELIENIKEQQVTIIGILLNTHVEYSSVKNESGHYQEAISSLFKGLSLMNELPNEELYDIQASATAKAHLFHMIMENYLMLNQPLKAQSIYDDYVKSLLAENTILDPELPDNIESLLETIAQKLEA